MNLVIILGSLFKVLEGFIFLRIATADHEDEYVYKKNKAAHFWITLLFCFTLKQDRSFVSGMYPVPAWSPLRSDATAPAQQADQQEQNNGSNEGYENGFDVDAADVGAKAEHRCAQPTAQQSTDHTDDDVTE